MMKFFLMWLLHERVVLMAGTMLFALIVLKLIAWNASAVDVAIFSGIMGNFSGALIRGIVGHIQPPNNEG